MPSISSPRWSGQEAMTLQRAMTDPRFLAALTETNFTAPQLNNWVRAHEVPVTYRAALRAVMNAWANRQAQTNLR